MKLSRALVGARQGAPGVRGGTAATPRQFGLLSSSCRNVSGLSGSPCVARSPIASRSIYVSNKNKNLPVGYQQHQQQQQSGRRHVSTTAPPTELRKTSLHGLHLEQGGKMVPFGGYEMPVQYSPLSVSASHHFTRDHASLFDVGHMVQHIFEGAGAEGFLQRVTPASLAKLSPHSSTLSALLWPGTGGIVDDTIITRLQGDKFYVVTNAACRDKDLGYLSEQMAAWRAAGGAEVRHEVLDGQGLVALQGPESEPLLTLMLSDNNKPNLKELYFGSSMYASLQGAGSPALISRGGYTGEDGFEISLAPEDAEPFVRALLAAAGPEKLQLAGLGARDSLRLEAGMCLYGHDLDDTTTPIEAALSWIIGKDRRIVPSGDGGLASFHGAEVVVPQLTPKIKGGRGVDRRRVGLTVEKGAPAREGAQVVDPATGEVIGNVTSGCPSPTLGTNIAMGYVKDGSHKRGTELEVLVRGKRRKAVVTKMPFVPSKYWKGAAPA